MELNFTELNRALRIGLILMPFIEVVDGIMLRSKLRNLPYNPFALPEEMEIYLRG
jgi:hypothetical protein